jgi:hypothetical protein
VKACLQREPGAEASLELCRRWEWQCTSSGRAVSAPASLGSHQEGATLRGTPSEEVGIARHDDRQRLQRDPGEHVVSIWTIPRA